MTLVSIIESILFVYADPIDIKMLVAITQKDEQEVRVAIDELVIDYKERGLALLIKDDTWQVASNPKNADYIKELVKSEFTQELSRSALETLAVIAYRGPLSRIDIDYLRGVNSSFTLRNLLMRGLIERIDNKKDNRSFLYRVSFDFLKNFGLTSMDQLPRFEEFNKKKIEILLEDTLPYDQMN